MKISIITATMNDGDALRRAVDSVCGQLLPPGVEVEHIVVNGGSRSASVDYAASTGARVIETEPKGVYNAVNAGIAVATGDVIGLVHGSDFLADSNVLARVAASFEGYDAPDFIFGDVNYCNTDRPDRIVRYYSAEGFTQSLLLKGFAPPHPSLFIRRSVMTRIGPYREDMIIAGDFDIYVRLFYSEPPLRYRYVEGPTVTMSTGGLSSGFLTRIGLSTTEICKVLRDHGLPHSRLRILSRFFLRGKRKSLSADD